MKTKFYKTGYLVLLSLFVIGLAGCIKGDMGPQGEKGDNGANGATGATGAQGPAGNANVSSETFNVSSGDWNSSYSINGSTYYYTLSVALNAPIVTSDIVNSGVVEVFMLSGSSGNWLELPWIYRDFGPTEIYNFSYNTGTVNILDYISDGTEPIAAGGKFKVVAIASSSVINTTKINWSNYNDIKRTFNLKD